VRRLVRESALCGAQPETGAADQHRREPSRVDGSADRAHGLRVPAGARPLAEFERVEEMVRPRGAVGGRGLAGADFELAEDLAGVGAHHLAAE
jgi:hypothetical protein